jgi:hypothetical protein
MTHITLVYKQKSDGRLCRSCSEVKEQLRRDGFAARIDRTLVADERDLEGEGWVLARRYCVRTAPFFLVERDGVPRIYTSYPRLVRDVLQPGLAEPLSFDEALLDAL